MQEDLEGLGTSITNAYHALKEVSCIEDVYDIIDYISEEARQSYNHIVCKVGCSDCCKGLHQPYITAAEWEYILYYLNDLPKVVQDEIVRRAKWYIDEYKDALLLQMELISGRIQTQQEIDKAYKTLAKAMRKSTCPFLVVDRCGIYPVRPAKCRSHGNFLVQANDKIRVQTCLPQSNEWEEYLDDKGNRNITLPLWNVYEQVISILNPPNTLVAPIAIWLITHIRDNKILDTLNPNPEIAL